MERREKRMVVCLGESHREESIIVLPSQEASLGTGSVY